MNKVRFLLRDKGLPLETQTKVTKYLEFVWKQEQKEDPEHEEFIMNKLSSGLRDEIFLNTYVQQLRSVPAFRHFTEKTLILFSRHLKKIRLCPEEAVYSVINK